MAAKEVTSTSGPLGGGPLQGVNVLDLTRFLNGPDATRLLADYGATVIKVENPKGGDETRKMSQGKDGYNTAVQWLNRGKRSLTLDLHKPESRPVMERLVKWAHVITENFKPGTLAGEFGYTYDQFKEWNPSIIYATNSGFGDRGPMGRSGSFDGVAQAFSGVMHGQGGGASSTPQPVDFAFSDEVGAMSFAQGILMAIVYQKTTGKGQRMDTSQVGATIQFQGSMLSDVLHKDGRQPENPKPGYAAALWMANQYQGSDGKYFQLAPVNFKKMLRAIGRTDLADHEHNKSGRTRNKNSMFFVEEMQKTFKTKTRDEWLEIFDKTNTGPAGPVYNYKELMEHEQPWANGYLVKQTDASIPGAKEGGDVVVGKHFRFSESPAGPVERGPALGEHNDWVLKEQLGLSQAEIEALDKANATSAAPKKSKL